MSEENRIRLPQLDPSAFQHPLDRTATAALEKVPGLDWVIRKFLTAIGERRMRLMFLASAVRVGDDQMPRIQALYDEACEILDIEKKPELYVAQKFDVNAAAVGVDDPFIVVTSATADMMDDDELKCILAHELGHVMCGHALYNTLLLLLLKIWYVFLGIPGGIYAIIAIRLALLEWKRKAELSGDRAGLLVTQDPEVSYRVDMKLAGGGNAEQMSLDAFFKQAEDYEAGGDILDGMLKLANLLGQTHPFPVLRVVELRRWVESGDYQRILDGDYPKRGERQSTWLDEVKRTVSDYKGKAEDTADPLLSTLRDLGGGAKSAGADLIEILKNMGR